MTTIAWDGKVLAADGRATSAHIIESNNRQKIFPAKRGMVLKGSPIVCWGFAGDATGIQLIKEWIETDADAPSEFPEEFKFNLLVITESSVWELHSGFYGWYEIDDKTAIGSGEEFAISAMALNRTAVAAIQHAITLDAFSGGTISYINCRDSKHILKQM